MMFVESYISTSFQNYNLIYRSNYKYSNIIRPSKLDIVNKSLKLGIVHQHIYKRPILKNVFALWYAPIVAMCSLRHYSALYMITVCPKDHDQ